MEPYSLGPFYDLLASLFDHRTERRTLNVRAVSKELGQTVQHLYKAMKDNRVPAPMAFRLLKHVHQTTGGNEYEILRVFEALAPLVKDRSNFGR